MTDNQVRIFNFKDNEVRTVIVNNEPWFVGKDVAEILGYAKSRNAIATHVDLTDKISLKEIIKTSDLCPPQNRAYLEETVKQSKIDLRSTMINESGVYSLILGSELPTAQEFKHWVTSVVLPSIRKTGGYILGEEQMNEDQLVLAAMQVLQRKVEALGLKVEELTPKAEGFDYFLDTSTTFNLRDTATMLGVHSSDLNFWLEYGANWMYRKQNLQHEKFGPLYPREAYKCTEGNPRGYFKVKPIGRFAPQARVTPLGLEAMRELLKNFDLAQWVEEKKASMDNQLSLFED